MLAEVRVHPGGGDALVTWCSGSISGLTAPFEVRGDAMMVGVYYMSLAAPDECHGLLSVDGKRDLDRPTRRWGLGALVLSNKFYVLCISPTLRLHNYYLQ